MFPESSPYIWFGVSVAAVSIMAVMWFFDRHRSSAGKTPVLPASESPSAVADGRETAKRILRADDMKQIHILYSGFKAIEGRFMDHFVNMAYMRRLDEAGKKDEANALYQEVVSRTPDSLRDDLEFSALVIEERE